MAEHAEKDDDVKAVAAAASPMKLVMVGAAALFVALLGAQVAAPLINRALESGSHGTPTPTEELAEGEEGLAAQSAPAVVEPALYTPLDPPFVVSFDDPNDGTRYLQLTVQAMARNEQAIAAIKQHAPAVRNAFLFLLSGYKIEELATLEGKEKLRTSMLASAKEILRKNSGDDRIADLYFTSLVIQ